MNNRESKMEQDGWRVRSSHCDDRSAQRAEPAVMARSGVRALFLPLVVGCSMLVVGCFHLMAQLAIDWHTIDGGGGTSTGGVYVVSGTIGQPDANQESLTGANYSLTGGFWALYAVQTAGAPTLLILPAGPALAQISWTPDTGSHWVLQETSSLSPAVWTNSPSGSSNPIVVPAVVSGKFYRLFRP